MQGISIVIPTLNRKKYLLATVECLLVQDFDLPYEIIIVDQSDIINHGMIELSQHSNVEIKYYHIVDFRGLPEARNFGVQHAQYEFILFLDDDIKCKCQLLKEHYKYLKINNVAIVAGGISEDNVRNIKIEDIGKFNYFSCSPKAGFHINHCGYVDHARGANFSIKKDVFLKAGGIDEYMNCGAALGEETEICLRVKEMGYKIFFNFQAHVWHLTTTSGGCIVSERDKYVYSLVHNKALLFSRHLKWYHQLTAFFSLLRIVISCVILYQSPYLFMKFFHAYKEGYKKGKLVPKYTIFNHADE